MISIIVPVYNEKPYLRPCLDSILSQSCVDWELILVNDGSTDGSGEICEEYASKDARISVLHQQNCGPAKARNQGLQRAKGEYIAFIDSDDLLHRQYLKSLLLVLQAEQADVVQSTYVLLSEQKRTRYTSECLQQSLPSHNQVKSFTGKEAIASMLYQREMDSSPIKLYRREVLSMMSFPEQFVAYEDLYGLLNVYARCTKTVWIDLPIYYYFKRMDGTLNTWSVRDERALVVMDRVQTWIEEYDKTLLPAVCSRRMSMAFNILRILSKIGVEKNKPLAEKCWQVVKKDRWECLKNSQMRIKNKLGILLSFFGKQALIKSLSFTI